MGNSVSEYEAVHNLMLQQHQRTAESSGASGSGNDFAKSGCVPAVISGRASFIPDKTAGLLNLLRERTHMSGTKAVVYQSASLQKTKSNKYHSKVMREFLTNWNINDLFALVEEYENLHTLKSFVLLSNKARQYASTCRKDLANLIESKLLADVQLVYETVNKNGQRVQMGPPIQCHKAILAARSEYFKHLFLKYRSTNSFYISSQVDPNVNYAMFTHFIQYLYSNTHDPKILSSYYLNFLLSKFKCNRGFKEALNYLRFSDTQLSDSVLLFKNSNPQKQDVPVPLIYQCHKSVLCARSKFFSSYLKRKSVNQSDLTSDVQSNASDANKEFNGATQIVLDTEIVNPKYGRILMDALYLDTIDLRNITNVSTNFSQENNSSDDFSGSNKTGSLKSANVIADAMELYVIAGLLDVPVLAQGCEDIILRRLSESNVVRVLYWASESHGSNFVYRQCVQFIIDEFATFSQTENFLKLNQEVLMEVLQSDFVQASELQVLKSVLRWAQFQIDHKDLASLDSAGLLDDYSSSQTSASYEPCSSSSVSYHRSVSSNEARNSTVHESSQGEIIPSVSTDFDMLASATDHNRGSSRPAARKTNWRHRLSHRRKKSPGTNSSGRNSCSSTSVDSEASKMDKILFRVAAPLLALVRVAHVIPKTSTTYTSAIKRKLITVPYIADAPANLQQSLENTSCNGWIRSANFGDYIKPRLFLPYFNEAKIALADQLSSGLSYEQLRFLKDYRAKVQNTAAVPDNLYMVDPRERSTSLTRTRSCPSVRHQLTSTTSAKLSSLVPIPDQEALRKMIAREHELQNSADVKEALLQTTTNKLAIQREIQKSVVREFGYPDDVIEVLQNPLDYYNMENLQFLAEDALEAAASNVIGFAQVATPRVTGQVPLIRQKDKTRPISQVDLAFDRLASPAKTSTAAELTMMSSAFNFPDALQDVEQDSITVPKYSSRTLPSNRSARNRILRTDNDIMSNPPNIVPVGGIPCDLIPRKSANRPIQLPFADILQDINMTVTQKHSDSAKDTPEPPLPPFTTSTSSSNPAAASLNHVVNSQLGDNIQNAFHVSRSESSSFAKIGQPNPELNVDVRVTSWISGDETSEPVPMIPPRIPMQSATTNHVPSNHSRTNCAEFRCYKHTPGPNSNSPIGNDEVPPPIPPRNSLLITNAHAMNHEQGQGASSNAGVLVSPGAALLSREMPPDLTLPSSVHSSQAPQRKSWLCSNRIDLCRGEHSTDFKS